MATTNDAVDPRAEIPHEIARGQVYIDSRTDEEYRILYEDAEIVLLRENTDEGVGHRLDRRGAFESYVGSDRFSLTEPGSETPRVPDEVEPIRTLIYRKHDEYSAGGTRTDTHKAEAMAEFASVLDEYVEADPDPVDLESVDGIGSKAAENLRDEGFRTEIDIKRADPDRIKGVPLMGESNTQNLLDEVGE